MPETVEELSKTALNPVMDTDCLRAKSIEQLASYWLDVRAFNALYSLCAFPDVYALEQGLMPIAGKSIGKIISARDLANNPLQHHPLNPKFFDEFHPEALKSALKVLTDSQIEGVFQYALKNTLCSATLTRHFYKKCRQMALASCDVNNSKAILNAKNAIIFFARLKNNKKNFDSHFDNIIMHIIAKERRETIYSLYLILLKKYSFFDPAEAIFEKYSRFHVMLIAKLVCRDFSNIQTLFAQLKEWITHNMPGDICYINILEMLLKGDNQAAHKALTELNELPQKEQPHPYALYFYPSWRLAVNWLIQNRSISK